MNERRVVSYSPIGQTRAERRKAATLIRSMHQSGEAVKIAKPAALPHLPAHLGGTVLTAEGRNYWNPFRIRQPEHQGTSYTLAAMYPFLAGPPIPAIGPVLGIDLRSGGEFAFDSWEWYDRGWASSYNILVAGGYRQGKSFFVKMLVCRSILFGRQGINTSDVKGEHVRIARAIGGVVIEIGAAHGAHRVNGLDRGPRQRDVSDEEYEMTVASRRSTTLASLTDMLLPARESLLAAEYTALEWALQTEISNTDDMPTLGGVYRLFEDLSLTSTGEGIYPELYADSRRLRHALKRLVTGEFAGLFDGPSTVTLDLSSPYTVFDTSRMMDRGPTAMALSQVITNSWVNAVIADKTSGRKFFVLAEEGWAEMKSEAALEAMIVRQKLSGEFKICTIMVVHEGGDFKSVGAEGSTVRSLAETLVNGFANKVTFRQEAGQLAASAEMFGLTPEDVITMGSLDKGQALVKIKDRPYLISTMDVSSEWERELFNTDGKPTDSDEPTETNPAQQPPPIIWEDTPQLTAHDDHAAETAAHAAVPARPEMSFDGHVLSPPAPAQSGVCSICEATDQHRAFCTNCGASRPTTALNLPPSASELHEIAEATWAAEQAGNTFMRRRMGRTKPKGAIDLLKVCPKCLAMDQRTMFCAQCGAPLMTEMDITE